MEKISDLGTIKISKTVFGALVMDAIGTLDGRAFVSSEKGKQLMAIGGGMPSPGEVAEHLHLVQTGDRIELSFCIILKFGAGINKVTDQLFDYIEQQLRLWFPKASGRLCIRVTGVKSKHIAERNIEVEREWS